MHRKLSTPPWLSLPYQDTRRNRTWNGPVVLIHTKQRLFMEGNLTCYIISGPEWRLSKSPHSASLPYSVLSWRFVELGEPQTRPPRV